MSRRPEHCSPSEMLRVEFARTFARGLMIHLGTPAYESARLTSRKFGVRLWEVLRVLPANTARTWSFDGLARPRCRPTRITEIEEEETAA